MMPVSFSSYLTEIFEDGKDIEFYSLKNVGQVADKVAILLDSPQKIKDITRQAYEKCITNHTWHNRAEKILEIINR